MVFFTICPTKGDIAPKIGRNYLPFLERMVWEKTMRDKSFTKMTLILVKVVVKLAVEEVC